jgi:hypothetical protein
MFNLAGGTVPAVDACIGAQWGFLLLEAAWAIIAACGLVRQNRPVAEADRDRRAGLSR